MTTLYSESIHNLIKKDYRHGVDRLGASDPDKDVIVPFSPVCRWCEHYGEDKETASCKAYPYPYLIPKAIWTGEHDHKTVYEGDKGIRFKKRSTI